MTQYLIIAAIVAWALVFTVRAIRRSRRGCDACSSCAGCAQSRGAARPRK